MDSKQNGKWIDRFYRSSTGIRGFIGTGVYVEGENTGQKHGQWVNRHPNGDILIVEYGSWSVQDPVFWYDYDDEKCWSIKDIGYDDEKRKMVNKKNCLE